VLQNPGVGLLFLVPGKADTLRVNGRAQITQDAALLDRMIVRGDRPRLALAVQIDEAFFHCAKCVMRSGLWDASVWPALDGLAPLARILADQTQLMGEEEMQAAVDESYRDRLY
jgi:predicted pyridoxine 5'-phosphate oxidase superfamily flavin-nucleotide-binding protein